MTITLTEINQSRTNDNDEFDCGRQTTPQKTLGVKTHILNLLELGG